MRMSRFLTALWVTVCFAGCKAEQNAPANPSPETTSLPPSGTEGTLPIPETGDDAATPAPTVTAPTEMLDPAALAACDAGDRAFVHRAIIALLGRRPLGQGELQGLVSAIEQVRSAQTAAGEPDTARLVVARALMQDDAFRVRWSDFLKDALRAARTDTKNQEPCYGSNETADSDGGALARFVRDNDATASDESFRGFTMRQLLASALELDDLSVLYRANLFAMMSKPLKGNSLELELELARRNDFGAAFEATYTRRDISCLPCHNSEFSVTASPDPATNRFWQVPALFERALFGNSTGTHPAEEVATLGTDVLRSRGMFRYMGVVGSGTAPFGWAPEACGIFEEPSSDDPLHIDTWFGSLRSLPDEPTRGQRMSVWELERSLRAGFEALAAQGMPNGEVEADEAFASLVALHVTESVWLEVMGTPLTVGHHFPRTAVQRDMLSALSERFVGSHYSLKELLAAIVEHGVFNLQPPSVGCGAGPYPFPRLFDPWTEAESDPEARGNGPSDAVFPLSPRVLRRSLHTALEWPMYLEYPESGSAEETLSLSLGFFLRDSEPGRRGLDFQGRLAWEAAYGSCAAPETNDFISKLESAAVADSSATMLDAIVALKDRMIGEPYVAEDERAPLEALLETSLDAPADALDGGLRRLCGVLASSPMFMLGGMVAGAEHPIPKLTPSEASKAAVCSRIETALGNGMKLECAE